MMVFPGPIMPWSNNPSLELRDMYDQVYSYLISSSQYRDTILRVLGQIIVAKDMAPHMDNTGSPANANRIATTLGLKRDAVLRAIADVRMMLEVEDTNIKIQDPTFYDFLLDRSRSKDLSVDLIDASLTLQFAAPIRNLFGARGICTMSSATTLRNDTFDSISFLDGLPWSDYALEQQPITRATGHV